MQKLQEILSKVVKKSRRKYQRRMIAYYFYYFACMEHRCTNKKAYSNYSIFNTKTLQIHFNSKTNDLIQIIMSENMTQLIQSKQTQQQSQSIQVERTAQRLIETCTKHKDKKGEFFQSQYAWIRYCEGCALNLALCGKKIQKCLNSQQMFNKIKLGDILKSITASIKQCEKAHQQQSLISVKLQQYRQQFSHMIRQIDNYIIQIQQIRGILEQSVQKYLNKQIKDILEKQNLVIGKKMSLINEKSKIQCGFVQLISKQNKDYIGNIVDKWEHSTKEVDYMKLGEQRVNSIAQNINKLGELFNDKLSAIKMINVNAIWRGSEINQPLKELYTKTQVTSPTLEDEELSTQFSGRVLTAYSTIPHSSLVSPCGELDSTLNILQQKEQNSRKMTRTSLKLKVRCRSGEKKRVQINTKENGENFTKRKI